MDKPKVTPAISTPKVTMPSGGGALRGIGEPFKAQSFNGSGGFSVSFPLPEARGFSPSIDLSYNSASGNGLFGLGFSIALDSIVRKTSNGIPKYEDSDVFILNSAGDLLPKYVRSEGQWVKAVDMHIDADRTWVITAYRPRLESGFARIEYWSDTSGAESYWKVITGDNISHLYGTSDNGRIYDPADPGRIFEWLIERSYDAHGNEIVYHYKPGDRVNLPDTLYNAGRSFCVQRYPESIQFGKYFSVREGVEEACFAFEVIFDYGQIDRDNPDALPTSWSARPDPFSTYKSGFEIRTDRLCRGIYLRHYFTEENDGKPFITAALLPEYDTTVYSGISRIKHIFRRGYQLQPDGSCWIADTPPVSLGYQDFEPMKASWETLQVDAPGYLNASGFLPVDLDGIGMDGLLYSTSTFTGYLEPLGEGRYAPMRVLENFPVFRNLSAAQAHLTSLYGNHALDLVVDDGRTNGYFARVDSGWADFRPFPDFPIEKLSTDRQMVDLSGTGRSDLFFCSNRQLKAYASVGHMGYSEATFSHLPEGFPITEQQDAAALLGFADFLGDGLSHRFRLRNGELTVWPCLGNGRFGAAISLTDAPFIEEGLDATRVFLIDADGSGATDIVYCFSGFARIWFNRNGNGFSAPVDLKLPGEYDVLVSVTAGDVSGYGTSALIFTTVEPEVKHWYYDFSNKLKPYLLRTIDDGMGCRTMLGYTTSVLEHLSDKREGRNWPTQLPLPVSVVHESKIIDQVTGAEFTQRFRYHDGYFDPVERAFRGFGYVETWDSESYEQFTMQTETNDKAARLMEKNLWTPPVYSRSWFITGAYEQTPALCERYASEFYKGDRQQWRIPAFELDVAWQEQDAFSVRQAYASLAGQPLRTEVYADDRSEQSGEPYTVSQFGVLVTLVQPRLDARYCSVLPVQVNELHYTYDRNPEDPLIAQQLVLSLDEYGHPLRSAAVSYPRRSVEGRVVYPEQQRLRVLLSETAYINVDNTSGPETAWQLLGIAWESRQYEIDKLKVPVDRPFSPSELEQEVAVALQQPAVSDDTSSKGSQSRLLSWSRQLFWDGEGKDALPYGEINELALLHHQEMAVLDPDELQRVFGDKINTELLTDRCGYVFSEGYWWSFGGMQEYNFSSGAFYLPVATQATITGLLDTAVLEEAGLNGRAEVEYDMYNLLITKTTSRLRESVKLEETYEQDYQSLMPVRQVDVNENVSEVLLDPLNRVIVSAVYGTIRGAASGDLPLSEYVIQEQVGFDLILADPDRYLQGASTYFFYDSFAWQERQQPVSTIGITRSLHVHEAESTGATAAIQLPISIAYSDGLGNVLQQKEKTTAGSLQLRRVEGQVVSPLPDETVQERWLVSGHTVYNNKGLPVEQYQSYFSATPSVEDQQAIVDEKLVPPPTVLHYDPIGRVIRSDSPKGFFSKTVYTPWETKAFDFNDTLPESPYYNWFLANFPADPNSRQQEERFALEAALPCYRTPSTVITDNLGNPIRTIACNLGAVGESDIPDAVTGSMTPLEAWSALLEAGYLIKEDSAGTIAWVSAAFQPYQSGFHDRFLKQFPENGEALENYLAQSCMTTYADYDIQGRQLSNADPRLFLKMIREEIDLFNFRSTYGMEGQVLLSESADAGSRWSLSNMAGNVVCSWDGRGFLAENSYDNLQRPTGLFVSGGDEGMPLANWVHRTEYGEVLVDAADCNLMGKPYREFDESGLSLMVCCDPAGAVLQSETRLRADYKKESDWTDAARQAILQQPGFTRSATYNVAGQVLVEVLPDGSQQANTYDLNGRLQSCRQQLYDPVSGMLKAWSPVMEQIDYDANGKRLRVAYGNGIVSAYTYDAFTGQLLRTFTNRLATEAEKSVLQDLYYTYDPVGHTRSVLDNNASVTFYNNQKIVPRSRYGYDPLYRVIRADGLTLPGLNTTASEGESMDIPFDQISHTTDLQNLENYSQRFGYDFGDNLILKKHIAASGSRTHTFFIDSRNNHLHGSASGSSVERPAASQFDYDGNGNLKMLHPNNAALVNWNYLNHISRVTSIERQVTNAETGEQSNLNDAEYYQYNLSGNRVRKVTEHAKNGGAQMEYTEKIYLGNFQRVRTWTASAEAKPPSSEVNAQDTAMAPDSVSSDGVALQSEKYTILLKDGQAPVLLTHIWVKAPSSVKASASALSNGAVQYRYQLCDPLDSVTMELNESAELLTYEQYFVYGGTAFSLARSQLEADCKELRFCGKERDAVTGLYYYGARYYAPWLARWMSPDPAGAVDGPNLYEYVSSNPVSYNDPTGMGKNSGTSMPPRRSPRLAIKAGNPAPIPVKAPVAAEKQVAGKKRKTSTATSPAPASKKRILVDYTETKIDNRESQLFGERFSPVYNGFSKTSKIRIQDENSKVGARFNWGAPYIFGDGLANDYTKIFKGVKGKQEESEVADILLKGDYTRFNSDDQRDHAFKLEAIVGVAEEWRKQGAGKIFRGFLRSVQKKELEFSAAKSAFHYIKKADKGRIQANLFKALSLPENRSLAKHLPEKQRLVFEHTLEEADGGYDTDQTGTLSQRKALQKDRSFKVVVEGILQDLREKEKKVNND